MLFVDGSEIERLASKWTAAVAGVDHGAAAVVSATAEDTEHDGKAFAPVLTGELRDSITTTLNGLEALVGPTSDHGRYVEDGTSDTAPQPYMGPALAKNARPFEAGLGDLGVGIL